MGIWKWTTHLIPWYNNWTLVIMTDLRKSSLIKDEKKKGKQFNIVMLKRNFSYSSCFLIFFFFVYVLKKIHFLHMFLKRFIWSADGILTGTSTPSDSWNRSNENEENFYSPQSSRTWDSASDAFYCQYSGHLFWLGGGQGFYTSVRDTVSVF